MSHAGSGLPDELVTPMLIRNLLATAEEMKEMQVLMKDFLEHLPDFKGRATPQESVEMMMKVIDAWTVDDSGATVSHYGKGEKWL